MQYFFGPMSQKTSNSSLIDNTPPTFSGVSTATQNTNGSISVSWGGVTEAQSNPVEFNIYIALGSVDATTLFVTSNLVLTAPASSSEIQVYTLADQTTYLRAGQVYTFGVRAKDAVGNLNTNTAIATATSLGVLEEGVVEYVRQLTTITKSLGNISSLLVAEID